MAGSNKKSVNGAPRLAHPPGMPLTIGTFVKNLPEAEQAHHRAGYLQFHHLLVVCLSFHDLLAILTQCLFRVVLSKLFPPMVIVTKVSSTALLHLQIRSMSMF